MARADEAEDYPTQQVTFIVPFAPAGGTDILAHLLGQMLEQRLGKPFVLENRPGDGTVIATNFVAKSPPDGYTIMMAVSSLAIDATLYKKLPYDPVKDLALVALIASVPFVLVVSPALPVITSTISSSSPSKRPLSYGSGGIGAFHHLAGALFCNMAGIKMTHVPYRGTVPALNDLIGGYIQLMFTDLGPALALINAGKLRALAVTTKDRFATLPDVPPLADAGVPGFDAAAWQAVIAPAKTPNDIVTKLNTELNTIVGLDDVRARMKDLGMLPIGKGTPDELQPFWRRNLCAGAKSSRPPALPTPSDDWRAAPSAPPDIDRQLPAGDEIFLDHLAHFVHDAEAARRAFARCGFAPTPVSIQVSPNPAGGIEPDRNRQCHRDVFARLYRSAVQDRRYAAEPRVRRGARAPRRTASRRLRGRRRRAAHRRLAANGFAVRPLVHMSRPVETEAGAGTAAFTIARVEPGVMPEGRIQMLTHHTEETVWQKRWLTHPNSAIGLIDVVIAVADVEEAAQRFARFTGRAVTRTPGGALLRLDRGGVYLVSHRQSDGKTAGGAISDAAVHGRLCAARPIARRRRDGCRTRRSRMARHRGRHRRDFSRRARRRRVVLRRTRRRAAVAALIIYSAGTFSASAGTTSFTAPRQPLCVRSKMMPSGFLYLTS